MINVLVPPLSQTMETVTLVAWLKAIGDTVVKGEPLFVIETDKANLEIEAPASGVLHQIMAQAGSEVEVRSTIAVIAAAGETIGAGPVERGRAKKQDTPSLAAGSGGTPLPPERQNRLFASPRARRLAQEANLPLAEIKATGPQQMIVERDVKAYLANRPPARLATPVARRMAQAAGLDLAAVTPEQTGERVTRADVEAVLARPAVLPPADRQVIELSPTRRTIARRLVELNQAAVQVTLTREVDVTELVNLREQILRELSPTDPRPTYTDFLVSIVARPLQQHPQLNATTDGSRLEVSSAVHMGLAVDTERGLMVPVIKNAEQKGLLQLAQARTALIKRVLDGSITPAELGGGTFTLTNLGSLGVDTFTPIINPPQVAILGIGRIRPGPAVYEGALVIRQLLSLSLTFDHRVIDGAPAARFLAEVVRLIEKPYLRWL